VIRGNCGIDFVVMPPVIALLKLVAENSRDQPLVFNANLSRDGRYVERDRLLGVVVMINKP
jgi:hypothetical protein